MDRRFVIHGFVIFSLFAFFSIPAIYAETVSIPIGSSTPGCEESNSCFTPYQITIPVGGTVNWENNDSAAHTVTSGTPADGPDGKFDSGLFMAGSTFTVTFTGYTKGNYPYFCVVHPWMQGVVTIQESSSSSTSTSSSSVNGYVVVTAENEIKSGNRLTIDLEFRGSNGNLLQHVNHNIAVWQSGKKVLDSTGAHYHDGTGTHQTSTLPTNDNVVVQISNVKLGLNEPYTTVNLNKDSFVIYSSQPTSGGGEPPVIHYQYGPKPGYVGGSVEFDASDSSDPDGSITKYEWWFGDGESAIGADVSHKYSSPGSKNVVLKITDDDGYTDQESFTVNIQTTSGPEEELKFPIELVAIGIGVAAAAGGAGVVISKRKSSMNTPPPIPPNSPTDSDALKGRKCNVCGTNIPHGTNVCPSCGDTYS